MMRALGSGLILLPLLVTEHCSASALEGLAKARHPAAKVAAKAAGQAPAKQEVSKKRSCSSASFTHKE